MRSTRFALTSVAALLLIAGCQKSKAPPTATTADIEATQHEAQREVVEARAEAAKDVKSAAKVSGSDSKVVIDAKVTGAYDVAMAKADGDHKIATEKCLTLPVDMQTACQQQASADYEAAKAAAKATRLAKKQ